MKIDEFIDEMLVGQIGRIQDIGRIEGKDCHFLSFALICSGIEFLGACLDEKDFNESGLSEKRFKHAIEKLFSRKYRQYADILYSSLRCGIVHVALPKSDIGLTQDKERLIYGTEHLVKRADRLFLVSETFYKDFMSACEELKRKIQTGEISHPKLQTDFFSVPGEKLVGLSNCASTTSECSGSSSFHVK